MSDKCLKGRNDEIVIEFYRTRDVDDAHAVVGHETLEIEDLEGAVAAARLLARTLDMPQHPDSSSPDRARQRGKWE